MGISIDDGLRVFSASALPPARYFPHSVYRMWGSTKENSCPVILLIHLPSAQRRKKPLLGRAIIHIQTLFLAAVLTIQSRRFLCFGGNYSDLLGRRKAPLVPAPLPASANPIIAGSAVNDRAGGRRPPMTACTRVIRRSGERPLGRRKAPSMTKPPLFPPVYSPRSRDTMPMCRF